MSVTLEKPAQNSEQNPEQNFAQNFADPEQKSVPSHLIAERISGEQVKYLHKEMIGDYFFEPQTVAFFKSKVEIGYHIKSKDQVFFITREKAPTGNIGFTVRSFCGTAKEKGVQSNTEFNQLTHKTAMYELQNLVKKATSS